MTKNHLLVFGLLMLLWLQNSVVQAQDRCATMHPYVSTGGKNPKLKALNEFEEKLQKLIKEKNAQDLSTFHIVNNVYKIPIVFQIIHNGEAIGVGRNISKDRILAQLAVLNQDFRRIAATPGFNTDPRGADTQIEFILARRRPDGSAFPAGEEGINRVNRTSIPTLGAPPYAAQGADIESKIKPYSTVTQGYDGTKYMNFWSIDMSVPMNSVLGYAQFPVTSLNGMSCNPGSITTDGVVMAFGTIGGGAFPGPSTPYHLGRTATHEIGHWLGLRHIWGDATCGDDFCADTPTHEDSNGGCPTHPKANTCGTADEMFENYMDYSNDICMNIFTKDQSIRMRTTLENFRLSLINSTAGIAPAVNDASVSAIVSPISDVCGTTTTPVISIQNTGSAIITGLSVEYQINAGAIQTKVFTGLNIASGAITNLTLDPIGGVIIGTNTIRAVSKLPNGTVDANTDFDESNATFTSTGGTVPLLEGFENDFLPLAWGRENPNNDCVNWSPAVSSTLIGSSGAVTKAAVIPFSRTATSGLDDYLITRMLDLTVANPNTKFQFDVAYCQKTNSSTDRLRIQVSTDCGTTWVATPIYDKTGTPLTTRPSSTGDFIPSNALEWRKESIDLAAYIGQKVKFRFWATSGGGNNLYIDNVSFIDKPTFSFATSLTSTPEATTTVLSCYGYTDITIPVKASFAPAVATTLNVALTGVPTATAGTDFQLLTPTVTFPAGSAADQLVTVRIFDDAATEVSETFAISLALAVANTGFLAPAVPTNTVTIRDNDSFPLATVVWSENFETQTEGAVSSTGTGWLRRTLTAGANDWVIGSSTDAITGKSAYISNNATTRPVEYTNAGAIPSAPGITSRSRLVSPAIVTTGFTNLEISFDFKCIGEVAPATDENLWDFGRLYYSTSPTGTYQSITGAGTPSETTSPTVASGSDVNGGFFGSTPFANQGNITNFSVALPAGCNNQPALYFIWRWDNDANDGNQPPFVIDNIVLVTRPTPVIETVLNATTTKYLGPNSTVHFFNAANKLIAKIENPTAHDYGCTTVAIDRTGTTNRELWNATASTFLAEKTVLITPTNPNTSSALRVTTYYTAAEVTAYNAGATPNTMAANANVISTGGAISNITAATPFANGATNNVGGSTVRGTTLSGTDRFVQSSFVSGLATNNGFGTGNPNGPALVSFVNATTATPEAPTTASAVGDCRPYTDYIIPLRVSASPTQALTVTITPSGTATVTADYVILTPTVTFPAASAANQNATVRVFDDGTQEVAETIILNIAVAPSAPIGGVDIAGNASITLNIAASDQNISQVTLFSENFEGLTLGEVTGTPNATTWSAANITATPTNKWVIGENGTLSGTKAAYVSQNMTTRPLTFSNTNTSRVRVVAPAINTTGRTGIQITFDWLCNGNDLFSGSYFDYGRLQYSTNGTTFITIEGNADANTTIPQTANPVFNASSTVRTYTATLPAACEGQTTLYLAWRWDNDGSGGSNPPFAIDNVVVTGLASNTVETALTSVTHPVGPNQTVFFVNAGKVMARIVNLSAHDYGCTTVAIDRNGTGATDLWNTPAAERAANKTFRVTPTNESATGSYELTLYHDATEVTGWQTATSKVWNTNAKMIRSGGAISNITPAAPLANGNTNIIATTTNVVAYNATSRGTTSTFTNMNLGGGFAIADPNNRIILGTITGTTFCQGETVNVPFTVAAAFNAGNVFTAQISNDNFATSTNIGTLTSTTAGTIVATIPTIAANTNYRIRVIGSNQVVNSNDNGVNLTITTTNVMITTQPTAQVVCPTQNATFSVVATNAGTYQWQEKIGAGAFANITNGGVYGGANSANLVLTGVTAGMNTNQYQCIVTSATCGSATSNAVTLTVNPTTAITTQPTAQTVCPTANATFTVGAAGVGLTYQWQEKVGMGAFTNIIGNPSAATASLTLTAVTAGMNTNQYQCIVTGTCGNATTVAVALTINAATSVNVQPNPQTVCPTQNATFTVAGIGTGVLTYQWQVNTGAGFTNITGNPSAATASLTLTAVTAGMNTYQYQCIITGTCGNATSNAVALTVNPATSVTTQPVQQTVCVGSNASFTVAGAGTGVLTYQWQEKVGMGAFTNITGNPSAATATLTLTAVTAGMSTNQYQCIVTGTCANATSNAVALTVTTPNAATITYTGSPFCSNATNPTPTIVGTTGGTFSGTPGLVFVNTATGQINLAASTAAPHTVTYTMLANAGCPLVTTTANITINAANIAPTINSISSLSLGVSAGLQTVNLSGITIGAGDTGQTLTVTATSSNLAVIPNPTVVYTPSNPTGSLTFTPVAAQTGNATITVTVTDNGSATCGTNVTTTTFFVSVGAPPPPPPPAPLTQFITFDSLQTVVFSNQLYELTATASSGLPVSYTISGNATLAGQNFLTLTGLGDITIIANQAGGFVNNTRYLAAAPVTRRLRVIAASQTLTGFDVIADRPWNSPNFQVRAITNSNLPITFAITEGANIAEIINGNIVKLKPAIGKVSITATQAGNATTNAATPIVRSFNVTKADQVINSIANLPILTYRVGLTQTLAASATSDLPVVASIVSGNATILNNVVSFTTAGTVVVRYAQAGNDLWNAATSVERTIVVNKAEQNIILTSAPNEAIIGTPQTVVANATSGLPVTMRVISGTATINGLVVTPTDGESVVIELNQAGDANFNAAIPVRFTMIIIPTLTLTSISGTKFCGGAIVTINFAVTGLFSGNNRMSAYLSDANGVFTNDRKLIGTVDVRSTGIIVGTIPANIPSGTGYKVRLEALFPRLFSVASVQTLELNAVPEVATISQDGVALVSSVATGVQWFANGVAISGATSQRYTPTAAQAAVNTLYSVVITNASGCTSVSGFANYQPPVVTGIDNPALSAKLSVYPNPTDNKITVELGLENAAKVGIKLTDAAGRMVFNETVSPNGLNFKHTIDMKDLASGVYMLLVNVEGKTAVKRIVKQ